MSPDALTEKRQLGIKMIRYLESLPRPRRWQETRHFTLSMNKHASYLDHKFIEQLKAERHSLHNEVTAGSKSGDSRFLLSMPDFVFAAIVAVDPPLQDELNDPSKNVSDRAWKKLANAFPEYKMAKENL